MVFISNIQQTQKSPLNEFSLSIITANSCSFFTCGHKYCYDVSVRKNLRESLLFYEILLILIMTKSLQLTLCRI